MNPEIIVVAHNIRSLWNVGALFRNADCFGVQRIILSGYTGTPPRREISKTALGADEWIPWEYAEDPAALVRELQNTGWRIVGLEQTERSISLQEYVPPEKICLLVGHEVTGMPEEHIQLCDDLVMIPMHGQKESLNVSVATGITLNHLRNSL